VIATSHAATVSQILMNEWDPIDIKNVPEAATEYEAYVHPIAERIASRTTVDQLAQHLMEIERDMMGLTPRADRARHVAEVLLRLKG
jgi:hypothetical protein